MKRSKRWLWSLLLAIMIFSLAACDASGTKPASNEGQGAPATSSAGGETGATAGEGTAGGAEGTDEQEMMHIDVLGHIQTGNRKAVEDRLTPIWREKTGVIPEIIDFPRGQDANAWLQMQIAGGTVPSVIAVSNNIVEVPERRMMLKNAGFLKPIPYEWVEENMPLTEQRLNNMGVTLEDWYRANADEDGLWYSVPTLPNPLIGEENRNTNYGKLATGNYPYFLYFRDDILKMIYPEARTEKEMAELIIEKNGDITFEEALDAPVYTREGLLEYLRKVKELDFHDDIGNFDIIPCHPSLTNVPERLYRSLMTATGIWWNEIVYTPAIPEEDQFTNFTEASTFKDYIQFLNIAYNEGLLGQEFLTQKDDQREAKMVNGEYAVVNNYFPVAAARVKAAEEGREYGWRAFPAFLIDLHTPYQDTRNICYTLVTGDGGKTFNPHKVTDEMMPKLLSWIDWNYSEEAAELLTWGTPDMYEGDGADRRFKPEYKDVENYLVNGIQNPDGKDGIYYGVNFNMTYQDITAWNHEVRGITGNNAIYVNAPRYVYPVTENTVDVTLYCQYAVRQYYLHGLPEDERHYFSIETALPSEITAMKARWNEITGEWSEVNRPYEDDRNLLLIGAIAGATKDFEANYTAYAQTYKASEIVAKEEELKQAYFDYYFAREGYRTRIDSGN